MPWAKKYIPKSLEDIQAQKKQVAALKEFVIHYKKCAKKGMILYGSTGSGKTSSVYALATELDLEIIEVNASDYRRPEDLQNTIGLASAQQSLFMRKKLILVDEVDGLSGQKDRGGVPALVKIIAHSKWPIVLTANDPFDKKFSGLRKVCEMVQFDTLRYTSVLAVLGAIVAKEGVFCSEEDLKALARRAGGDLRGAITDLEVLATTGRIGKEDVEELAGRRQKESMISALMKILRGTDPHIALRAFDDVEEDTDKRMLWMDQNMPVEYAKAPDRLRAYALLSKADIFLRRIRRWQHWRYLVYANELMSAGIAVAKDEKYEGYRPFKPTTRILSLWRANMKHKKKKDVCAKIAQATHTSSRRVMQDTLPYLRQAAHNDLAVADAIVAECDLNKDEAEWLGKV